MEIRAATASDDAVLVAHYLALWESYGVPPQHFLDDAEARVLAFIAEGRDRHRLAAFLAEEDGDVLGSAACQRHLSPYPEVLRPKIRSFGYVWSVFVQPTHRRRGIARALMERAIAHLHEIGCTNVVLHSSEAGLALYRSLGFDLAHEMRLPLVRA
jgi:ribosomal protein S18 acetylase RimI-like enzyme